MEKEEDNILNKFFRLREEELAENIEQDINCLKDKLKDVKQETIVELIEKLPEEYKELKQNILLNLDNLIANYNIKIAYYNKKYYKQGFEDSIEIGNLCKEIKK